MTILYLMVPIALVIALLGLGVFIWNVRSGQYDDLSTPAHRMLNEFESKPNSKGRKQQ
jgi:cbb3-type cytochrome oxidase maturation protein